VDRVVNIVTRLRAGWLWVQISRGSKGIFIPVRPGGSQPSRSILFHGHCG